MATYFKIQEKVGITELLSFMCLRFIKWSSIVIARSEQVTSFSGCTKE